MKFQTFFLLVLVCVLLGSSGCKKWRNNREPLTSEDHTLAEASFNDIFRHLLALFSPGGDALTYECFSYTRTGTGFPDTLTVDFGSDTCEGLFLQSIYGKVDVVLSNSFSVQSAAITAVPRNLYIKNYRVDGNITITNAGTDTSGYQQYIMSVISGTITAEKAKIGEDFIILWECNYSFQRIDDNGSALPLDDLHLIAGTAAGVNSEDRSFTAEITTALKKYADCRWPASGTTKIAPADLDERDLDYGSCEPSNCCDNVASEDVKWPDKAVRMK